MIFCSLNRYRTRRIGRAASASLLALTLAAVLGGGMGLAGCRRGDASSTAPTKVAPTAQSQAVLVSVTPARIGTISDIVEVTGTLNAQQDVIVGVKVAGKIIGVYAREGDAVTKGQIVAQQDTTDLKNVRDQQAANLLAAQTRLNQAKVAYQNAKTTLTLTEQQTQSAIKQAQAALDAAKEELAVVRQGARPQERQQAAEALAAARADRDKARSDLKRYQDLYRQQAISAQQLDQAQATADSAEARYNQSAEALSLIKEGSRQEDIRRSQAAVEQANQGVITAQANRSQVDLRRADVENARVGILNADAGIKQAEAALRLAAQAITDAAVRSPIDGVVAERKVEPGMQVAVTKPDVMRIVALDSIYFDAQLSETQFAQVQIGMPVSVTVDARPGETFAGKVKKVFPVASSTARSFTVRISLDNPRQRLRPQMYARGRITLAKHLKAVLIPRDAVLDFDGTKGRVFLVRKNTNLQAQAEERAVQTGLATIKDVEVRSGVVAGDLVVTTGQAQIQNGDKVQMAPGGDAPGPHSTAALGR